MLTEHTSQQHTKYSPKECSASDGQPKVLAIMGPTASGKTHLAVRMAQLLDGEVISVDSALVYRGLNIGAAKPSLSERQGIVHHLMDIRDPSTPYSAADFCRDATTCIEDILSRQKVPILAGGTMLYFKALLEGMSPMPQSDPTVRAHIDSEAAVEGWPAMHKKLTLIDPDAAARIHPNHSQRISRALEVWRISGNTMSQLQNGSDTGLLKKYLWRQVGLNMANRKLLHERIARRFQLMLDHDFEIEVTVLRDRGDLDKELPAIRAVGYRQMWDYLDGEINFQTMQDKALAATRQLAKRQLTWLRGWPGLISLECLTEEGEIKNSEEIVKECLSFW